MPKLDKPESSGFGQARVAPEHRQAMMRQPPGSLVSVVPVVTDKAMKAGATLCMTGGRAAPPQ